MEKVAYLLLDLLKTPSLSDVYFAFYRSKSLNCTINGHILVCLSIVGNTEAILCPYRILQLKSRSYTIDSHILFASPCRENIEAILCPCRTSSIKVTYLYH
jgi:hypothetical protein